MRGHPRPYKGVNPEMESEPPSSPLLQRMRSMFIKHRAQLKGAFHTYKDEFCQQQIKEQIESYTSYSPDLNPVELLNNDLKTALHKGEPARCKGKLKTKVRRHMMKRQREPHIVKKFFKKPNTAYAEDEDKNV